MPIQGLTRWASDGMEHHTMPSRHCPSHLRADMTTMHHYCTLGGEQDHQGPFAHPHAITTSGAACIARLHVMSVSLLRLAVVEVAAWRAIRTRAMSSVSFAAILYTRTLPRLPYRSSSATRTRLQQLLAVESRDGRRRCAIAVMQLAKKTMMTDVVMW